MRPGFKAVHLVHPLVAFILALSLSEDSIVCFFLSLLRFVTCRNAPTLRELQPVVCVFFSRFSGCFSFAQFLV